MKNVVKTVKKYLIESVIIGVMAGMTMTYFAGNFSNKQDQQVYILESRIEALERDGVLVVLREPPENSLCPACILEDLEDDGIVLKYHDGDSWSNVYMEDGTHTCTVIYERVEQ